MYHGNDSGKYLGDVLLAVSIPAENEINDATTAIFWEYEKDYLGFAYEDEWREGPEGPGPGTLGLDRSDSYTQSYSGTVGGSIEDINWELGLTIGETQETTARYDLQVPAGETWTILYRMKFKTYRVKQTQIRLNIATGQRTVLQTRYLTTNEFVSYVFAYRDSNGNIIT